MKPSRWALYAESSDIFWKACIRGQSAYYEWLLTPIWNIPRRLYLRSVCRRCQVIADRISPSHITDPIATSCRRAYR
jgi:hypothetical protein